MTRTRGAALLLVLFASGLSACGKVQAHAVPPPADLVMPPPPPRVLIPVELPPAEPPVTEPEPTPVAPPPAPPAKPSGRPAPSTPPVASPPPASTTEPAPAPVLQTTSDVSALEKKTREKLDIATSNLNAVKFESLSAPAREQFNYARGLIRQSHTALTVKNYNFAEYLANKAATVANLLLKG